MGQGSLVRRASLPVYGEGGPEGLGWGSPREPPGLDRGKARWCCALPYPFTGKVGPKGSDGAARGNHPVSIGASIGPWPLFS